MIPEEAIAATLMELAHRRGPTASFCPSEAARLLSPDWQPLMAEVRRVAADLPLVATQGSVVVDVRSAKGPIRLRLAQ